MEFEGCSKVWNVITDRWKDENGLPACNIAALVGCGSLKIVLELMEKIGHQGVFTDCLRSALRQCEENNHYN